MKLVAQLYRTGERTYRLRARAGHRFELRGLAEIQCERGHHTLSLLPEWIKVEQAAELLGVSESSVHRLCERRGTDGVALLVSRRPSPGKVQIALESARALKARTESEPDFWNKVAPLHAARTARRTVPT